MAQCGQQLGFTQELAFGFLVGAEIFFDGNLLLNGFVHRHIYRAHAPGGQARLDAITFPEQITFSKRHTRIVFLQGMLVNFNLILIVNTA